MNSASIIFRLEINFLLLEKKSIFLFYYTYYVIKNDAKANKSENQDSNMANENKIY